MINLCERPTIWGKHLNKIVLGSDKAISHPFLVLKTDTGEVLSELHGSWSPAACYKQIPPSKIMEFTVAAATIINADTHINTTFDALDLQYRPVNTMYLRSGQHQYHRAQSETPLTEDRSGVVVKEWKRIAAEAKKINDLKIPYTRYDINCQATLYTALKRANIHRATDIDLQFMNTGWKKDEIVQKISTLLLNSPTLTQS